ncbi:hypothetical protein ACH4U7_00985 [Streptomyces sp. NPDC020845]
MTLARLSRKGGDYRMQLMTGTFGTHDFETYDFETHDEDTR